MFCSRLKRTLATLAVGALVFASPAGAAAPEVEADYQLALTYWAIPAPPRCSSVSFVTSAVPADPAVYPEGAIASATIPTALHEACVVTTYPLWETTGPCMRRMVMRHETGHLQGYEHSPDPASIMHAPINEALWCPEEFGLALAQAEAAALAKANAEAEAKAAQYRAEAAATEAALDVRERREARCRKMHGKRARRCWRILRAR